MNKTFSLLLLLTGFIILSCNHKSIDIIIVNSNHHIEISVGDTLNLIFETNPSTGYQWSIENSGTSFIQQIDKVFIADNNNENIVGGGGKIIISFKSLMLGETIINTKYARPFELDLPPLIENVITIIVK